MREVDARRMATMVIVMERHRGPTVSRPVVLLRVAPDFGGLRFPAAGEAVTGRSSFWRVIEERAAHFCPLGRQHRTSTSTVDRAHCLQEQCPLRRSTRCMEWDVLFGANSSNEAPLGLSPPHNFWSQEHFTSRHQDTRRPEPLLASPAC